MSGRGGALVSLLLIGCLASPVGKSGTEREAFVSWARAHAIALRADDSAQPAAFAVESDEAALRVLIGKARVVALGESAHGTHEPLAFRNRLFRDLVERLGFTAIAVESGFCESQRVHDFVSGGPGEAAQIAHDGFSWGFGEFGENVELIRWIRDYNADSRHLHKVGFYGIDLCGGDGGDLMHSRVALDGALAYLQRVAPEVAREGRSVTDRFADRFTTLKYRELSAEDRSALHAVIEGWRTVITKRRKDFIAATSQSEYDWAFHTVIVAGRIEQALQAWPPDNPPGGVSPDLYKAVNVRDAAMAENVQWVLGQEGGAGRILLFAHNAHVMNASTRGGMWHVYREEPVAMGQHLRAALGQKVVIIGLSSDSSSAGLPTMTLAPAGVDKTLGEVGVPRFLVDLRAADSGGWAGKPHPLSAGFVTDHIVTPREAFDAFVYFERLTPSSKGAGAAH